MGERFGPTVALVKGPPLSFSFPADEVTEQIPYPVETRKIFISASIIGELISELV
jgi:hypothetical protein